MRRSWRTTLCGIIAAAAGGIAGMADLDPAIVRLAALIASAASSVGLMLARDYCVPSEAHGVAPTPIVIAGKTATQTVSP